MSLPIDYIFMNSRDKGVVIINILSSSRISIEFMMRNTILALNKLYYRRPLYCPPTNTSLFMFGVIPWVPCYPTYVMFYRGVLPSFMSRMLWGLLHHLRILGIVILLTITILSWSSVDSNRGTNKWTMLFGFCTSSNPIALKLMIDSSF